MSVTTILLMGLIGAIFGYFIGKYNFIVAWIVSVVTVLLCLSSLTFALRAPDDAFAWQSLAVFIGIFIGNIKNNLSGLPDN